MRNKNKSYSTENIFLFITPRRVTWISSMCIGTNFNYRFLPQIILIKTLLLRQQRSVSSCSWSFPASASSISWEDTYLVHFRGGESHQMIPEDMKTQARLFDYLHFVQGLWRETNLWPIFNPILCTHPSLDYVVLAATFCTRQTLLRSREKVTIKIKIRQCSNVIFSYYTS